MPPPEDDEVQAAAASWLNRATARALKAARRRVVGSPTQAEMARRLSERLGYEIRLGAYSKYENANRVINSGVLIAAAMLAECTVEELLEEANEMLLVEWLLAATGGGGPLPARVRVLEVQVREVRERLGMQP